jgi:hypothetical protein
MNKATSQPTVPVAGFCYETISTDIYIYNSCLTLKNAQVEQTQHRLLP